MAVALKQLFELAVPSNQVRTICLELLREGSPAVGNRYTCTPFDKGRIEIKLLLLASGQQKRMRGRVVSGIGDRKTRVVKV